MSEPLVQMLSWFEDDELRECPACHEKRVVPAEAGDGMLLCAGCGVVAEPRAL